MDAFATKGFYTVGALKSNRILYPCGVKMNVCEFARTLSRIALFHIVTVKGRKYYVYRYEGRLNDIENAVVLICYAVSAFGQEKALRTFICTNADLTSDEDILNLYAVRWEIEVYFRDCKNKLAFDKYHIRSANGIKRFWLITSLAYLPACLESPSYIFSEGYASLSQTIFLKGFHLFLTLSKMVGRSLPFWLWLLNFLLCILTNAPFFCSFIVYNIFAVVHGICVVDFSKGSCKMRGIDIAYRIADVRDIQFRAFQQICCLFAPNIMMIPK